jgi:hypothetical protein
VQGVVRPSTSHTPHAPKPTARGAEIEACVPIPQSSLVTFFQRKIGHASGMSYPLLVMLSLASQRRSIQTRKTAAWPSRLMSITPRRDGYGWAHAYIIAVGTCLRHVLLRVHRAEPRPTSLGCHGPFHDTNSCYNQKTFARGIGGGVRREASIEGVRFRCRLHDPSRLHSLHTHRNLRHAGWRLKRGFRFRKVLWLLSSKESNNKNKHRALFASRRGP